MQFARSILTVYFNRIVHKLLNVIRYARFVKRNVRHNCFVLSFYRFYRSLSLFCKFPGAAVRAANKLDSRPKRPCPSAAVTLITVASRANARLTTYPGKGHNTASPRERRREEPQRYRRSSPEHPARRTVADSKSAGRPSLLRRSAAPLWPSRSAGAECVCNRWSSLRQASAIRRAVSASTLNFRTR